MKLTEGMVKIFASTGDFSRDMLGNDFANDVNCYTYFIIICCYSYKHSTISCFGWYKNDWILCPPPSTPPLLPKKCMHLTVTLNIAFLLDTGTAVGKLLTLGGVGIWWIIDIVLLVTGMLNPADDSNWVPYFWLKFHWIGWGKCFLSLVTGMLKPTDDSKWVTYFWLKCLWMGWRKCFLSLVTGMLKPADDSKWVTYLWLKRYWIGWGKCFLSLVTGMLKPTEDSKWVTYFWLNDWAIGLDYLNAAAFATGLLKQADFVAGYPACDWNAIGLDYLSAAVLATGLLKPADLAAGCRTCDWSSIGLVEESASSSSCHL